MARHLDHATIADVATAAGVSRATAARALGGYGRVSPEARDRVVAAAKAIRYRPNAVARSMITGTTGTLGVVIADIELSFFARAVRGISDAANAEGFEVILANSDEDHAKERAAVGVMMDKRVDGLIVTPASVTEIAHLQELVDRGLPLVLLDRPVSALNADTVVVDNVAAAGRAADHLLGLGHRRVAILVERATSLTAADLARVETAPGAAMTSTLREVGWALALRRAGVAVTDDLILRSQYRREDAAEVAARALARRDRPTALITTDETMTLGALQAIRSAGLRIPEDISLVAFDDLAWMTLAQPPLTVVAQPVYELGVTAMQMLLGRLAGDEGPAETVVLDTRFVVRESTAAPAGS